MAIYIQFGCHGLKSGNTFICMFALALFRFFSGQLWIDRRVLIAARASLTEACGGMFLISKIIKKNSLVSDVAK